MSATKSEPAAAAVPTAGDKPEKSETAKSEAPKRDAGTGKHTKETTEDKGEAKGAGAGLPAMMGQVPGKYEKRKKVTYQGPLESRYRTFWKRRLWLQAV